MNDAAVNALKSKEDLTIDDLRTIVELLRAPDGCPWDKVQTHKSIRRDLIEETYEVVEGIDKNDDAILEEELGDLLLQVVFHARIAEEEGAFDLDRVADGISKKLILRHPHIFGDVQADTVDQVLTNWDAIKKVEKDQKSDREVLDAVSHALPGLMRASKIASKLRKLGYDVPDAAAELAAKLDAADANAGAADAAAGSEIEFIAGELLFAAAARAKALGIDPEKALSDACDRRVAAAKD